MGLWGAQHPMLTQVLLTLSPARGSLEKEDEAAKPFTPWSYLPVCRVNCTFNTKFFIFKNIARWFP